MKNISALPNSIQISAFFFLFAAYFLIFFNDFLGFEGALGLVLLFSIFIKFKYYRDVSFTLTLPEKALFAVISFYIVIMAFSTLINYQNYEDVEKFVAKYNKVLYFIAFVYILKFMDFSFAKFQFFIKLMATAIILMLLLEIYNYGLSSHLGGEYSNKGTGAWFFSSVLIATFFLLIYHLRCENNKEALQFLFYTLALALVIVFSSTRSIWLSLFMSFVLLTPLAIYRLKLQAFLNVKTVLILLVFITVIISASFNKISDRVSQAKQDIVKMQKGDFYTSLGMRVVMYSMAFEGFKGQPITGLGEVNYKTEMANIYESNKDKADQKMYKTISKFKQIHNQFLMDAWMKGILGLISIVLLFLIPWFIFYKSVESFELRIVSLIGLSFLVSSFFFFQFGAVLTYSHGIVFFFLWLILLVSVVSNLKSKV